MGLYYTHMAGRWTYYGNLLRFNSDDWQIGFYDQWSMTDRYSHNRIRISIAVCNAHPLQLLAKHLTNTMSISLEHLISPSMNSRDIKAQATAQAEATQSQSWVKDKVECPNPKEETTANGRRTRNGKDVFQSLSVPVPLQSMKRHETSSKQHLNPLKPAKVGSKTKRAASKKKRKKSRERESWVKDKAECPNVKPQEETTSNDRKREEEEERQGRVSTRNSFAGREHGCVWQWRDGHECILWLCMAAAQNTVWTCVLVRNAPKIFHSA